MKKTIYYNLYSNIFTFFLLIVFSVTSIIWVMQAVSFLDLVIDDGHSFQIYFNYTLLNLQKIISKIVPFAVLVAFIYILIKFENKNELIIFWSFGISKKDFAFFFIKFSLIFLILQIILVSILVPKSQDSARSFIRNSNIDSFNSIIKQKKFIDTLKDLTIYVDNISEDKRLNNFFLKDNTIENGYQIILADKGEYQLRQNKKVLVLFDGKSISKDSEGKINVFKFTKSDFNISKFTTKTTKKTKTQENNSFDLIKCFLILQKIDRAKVNINEEIGFNNCRIGNQANILKELYKRFIVPLYIPSLILTALLIILKSKDTPNYFRFQVKIFLIGIVIIIFSELSLKFISENNMLNLLVSLIPFFNFFLLYFIFRKKI